MLVETQMRVMKDNFNKVLAVAVLAVREKMLEQMAIQLLVEQAELV